MITTSSMLSIILVCKRATSLCVFITFIIWSNHQSIILTSSHINQIYFPVARSAALKRFKLAHTFSSFLKYLIFEYVFWYSCINDWVLSGLALSEITISIESLSNHFWLTILSKHVFSSLCLLYVGIHMLINGSFCMIIISEYK